MSTCEVKAEKMMRVRKIGTVIMMSRTTSTSSSSYSPPQLMRAPSRKHRDALTDSESSESGVEHLVGRGRQVIVPDHSIDMNRSTRPSPGNSSIKDNTIQYIEKLYIAAIQKCPGALITLQGNI